MSVTLKRDQSLSGVDDPVIEILIAGTSHTFQRRTVEEVFRVAGSAAVTIDLKSQLFGEMIKRRSLPANPLPAQVLDMQDWETIKRIIEKLDALDAVFGMLNELTSEQREAFEKEVKRRPLFE